MAYFHGRSALRKRLTWVYLAVVAAYDKAGPAPQAGLRQPHGALADAMGVDQRERASSR